jgi:hypothetical protein
VPLTPFDSEGGTVAADSVADAATLTLTTELQRMREEGADARTRATVIRNNAGVMRGNLQLAQSQIETAGESLTTAESNVEARREITAQGREALTVSEEKASQVAADAPGFVDRSSAAHEDSGPMASEAGATASEAAGQDPEDEEAAGKMQSVSSGMSQVGSDAGSVDGAVTETQTRAESLVTDAAEAQEKNTATGEKLDATEGALDEADERLGQLGEQNEEARTQVSALTGQPAQMEAGASDLDSQARAVVDHSTGFEAELRASEDSYQSDMRSIPGQQAIEAAGERAGGGESGLIQRSAESAYGGRATVDILGAFRSPPSVAEMREQERRRLEADERRRARIRDIETRANGDFSSLSSLDRVSIALDMAGESLWNSASEIDWPHMAGQTILAFIDPTVSLEGVIAGLNGIASGAANLFSVEQWEADPLGNLLKSAADIATGLTTLLGSIAGFCTAILVILGALAIFTFGAMGPVFAAASAFLGPIISTVGGWALVTAAIAAELHALVFIKNLIDAATADTAAELEHESDQMTEDATQFANAASQVVLDRIVEAGGAHLANTPTGRSLGAAIETVGRDFDMIPPPRMRPGVDIPATALAEGTAAAVPEPHALPEPTAATAAAPEPHALPEPAAATAAAPEPRPAVEPTPPPAAAEAAAGVPAEPVATQPPPRPVAPEPPPPPPAPPQPEPAAAAPSSSTTAHPAEPVTPPAASPETTPTRPPEAPPSAPEPAAPPAQPTPAERVSTETPPGGEAPAATEQPPARGGESEPPGRPPEGPGPSEPPSPRRKLDEHLENMLENGVNPEELGFSSKEWEQFQRDYQTNPEKALADLERRLDTHGARADAPRAPEGARAKEAEAHADDVRDQAHPRPSESTTAAEREAGRLEGERAQAERRAAAGEESPTTVPDERPSDLFDDPNAPTPRSGEPLQRPPLRDETMATIEDAAPRNEQGQFVDSEGNVVERPCFGHKCRYENRRVIAAAEELGMTQKQLNDFINEHPEYFFVEETAPNLSHENELPGLEPYDHILEDMEIWLRNRGGK